MARLTQQEFIDRLEKVSAKLAAVFVEAVDELRSGARLNALRAAIAEGDVEGAFRALRLDEAAFAPFLNEVQAAFDAGAEFEMSGVPNAAQVAGALARFNGNHPRAVAFARETAALEVTGPDGFIQEARRMVRKVIVEAAETNRPPRETALDIVGRRSPGGRRVGGILGLTENQEEYVRRMRTDLQTVGGMHDYVNGNRWKRRDRRFDRTIRKALREQRPLTKAELDAITVRYAERLLKLRGETVARTESLRALNAGRYEGVIQLLEQNDLPPDAVTLIWQSTPSKRTRDTHMALNRQEIKMGEAFETTAGWRLRHPGDTTLGAPAEEIINCRCTVKSKIDFTRLADRG